MTNTYMLRSGELWLVEAVEILAAARQPDVWSSCQVTESERAAHLDYLRRLDLFKKHAANTTISSFGGYLAGMTLADLANPPAVSVPEQDKPKLTEELIDIVTRSATRGNLLGEVWPELRQAFINGTAASFCFLEVGDNEKVQEETWGKPYNSNAHISGRVYLRKNPAGSGLLGGRAFLLRQDLDNLIRGNTRAPENEVAPLKLDTDPIPPRKPDRPSPKLDLAIALIARAFPGGIQATDKTVEIVSQAHRAYRKEDGPRPSDDVIKRAAGRKKS